MRSLELKAFIRKHSSLFWYIPEDKKEDVSDELLVETVLNYGTWESVMELFDLMSIKKTAEIFYHTLNISDRRRGNYSELTLSFFTKLFDKYAK